MTKRRLIFILGIGITVFLGAVLYALLVPKQTGNKSAGEPAAPTTAVLPTPDVQFSGISYRSVEALPSLPSVVAKFETSRYDIAAVARELAPTFGASGEPEIINSPKGNSYVWSRGAEGLLVGSSPPRITYSSPHPVSQALFTASDAEVVPLARNLLFIVSPDVQLSEPRIRHYTTSGDRILYVDRARAQAIELTFTYRLGDLPLLTGQPQVSEAIVRFDSTKTLRYLVTPIFRQIRKSEGDVSLLSPQAIYQNVIRGGGVLYHAGTETDANEPDSKFYSFANVTIRKMEPAYYYDAAASAVFPVVVVQGTATDTATKKEVETLTLVKATL